MKLLCNIRAKYKSTKQSLETPRNNATENAGKRKSPEAVNYEIPASTLQDPPSITRTDSTAMSPHFKNTKSIVFGKFKKVRMDNIPKHAEVVLTKELKDLRQVKSRCSVLENENAELRTRIALIHESSLEEMSRIIQNQEEKIRELETQIERDRTRVEIGNLILQLSSSKAYRNLLSKLERGQWKTHSDCEECLELIEALSKSVAVSTLDIPLDDQLLTRHIAAIREIAVGQILFAPNSSAAMKAFESDIEEVIYISAHLGQRVEAGVSEIALCSANQKSEPVSQSLVLIRSYDNQIVTQNQAEQLKIGMVRGNQHISRGCNTAGDRIAISQEAKRKSTERDESGQIFSSRLQASSSSFAPTCYC